MIVHLNSFQLKLKVPIREYLDKTLSRADSHDKKFDFQSIKAKLK